jgi:nucleotide-binding universal stress UspA family protein
MTYKTILAYISSAKRADAVLEVAVGLATKHDAHLIGLHVVPQVPPNSFPRYPTPNDMLIAARKGLQAEAEKIAEIFKEATKSLEDKCEWRSKAAQTHNQLSDILEDAMMAELVIASQEVDHPFFGSSDIATGLVLASGRPVLIVPNAGRFQTVGERIVVGWKPAREAARAILDALPLMRSAASVHVVSVDEDAGEKNNASNVCGLLARQDVQATAVSIDSSEPEKALLDQVKKLDSDLLVIGCFGRSRLREMVFGGVTRHILGHMTVPVLMSH